MRATVLVQAAQQILERPDTKDAGNGAGVAAAYAEMCSQANARLARCVGLAREGRIAEAVHAADEAPPLLELCLTLDFSKADQWRDLCLQKAWPVAATIDGAAIAVVNDAYAAGLPIEPLLQQYRVAMRKGNRAEAIPVLRRLVHADPANPSWKLDLDAFEERRLQEIAAEAAHASELPDSSHAVAALANLASELAARWSRPVPQDLLRQVERSLRAAEGRQASEQALRVAEALRKSHDARDMAEVERSLSVLDLLTAAHGVSLPRDAAATVHDARGWLERRRAEDADDHAWTTAHARLVRAVNAGDGRAASAAMDGLASFGRELPGPLADRARALAEAHRRAIATRRRFRAVLGLAAAALVLAVFILTLRRVAMQRRVAQATNALRECHSNGDLPGLTNLWNDLHASEPRVWRTEAVQAWRVGMDSLAADWRRAETKAHAALEWLDEQMTAGFPGDTSLYDLASVDAETACQHSAVSAENRLRLPGLVRAWTQERQRRRARTEARWSEDKQMAASRLASVLEDLRNGVDSGSLNEALVRIRQDVETASAAVASEEALKAQAESLANMVSQLHDSVRERDAHLEKMRAADSVEAYLDAAESLAHVSPRHPWAVRSAPFVRHRSAYGELAAGPTRAAPTNRFWGHAAVRHGGSPAVRKNRWTEFRRTILDLESIPELVDMYDQRDSIRRILLRGQPVENAEGGGFVIDYFIPQDSPTSGVPEFRQRVVTSSVDGIRTRFAYCAFVQNKVIEPIRFATPDAMNQVLDQVVADICATADVPSLLKIRLLAMIVEEAATTLQDSLDPDIPKRLAVVANHPQDLHWLCFGNSRYKAAEAEADRIIRALLDSGGSTMARIVREVAEVGAIRGIQFAGVVPLDGPTNGLPPKATAAAELWGLEKGEDRSDRFVMLAVKTDGGGLQLRPGVALWPGEPLFMPGDQATTAAHAQAIARRLNAAASDVVAEMHGSPVWPRNSSQ